MSILWLDIETRSRADLRVAGVYNYAASPSTEVICMAYAIDDAPIRLWRGGVVPPRVANHKGQIRAHNAAFERLVLRRALGLGYALEQFYCTAAQARANCAPGALDDLGRFAGTNLRKDPRGSALIRKLSVPRPDGTFNKDPALLGEMGEYCKRDVHIMREASKAMRQLSSEELRDYHTNERINDRGIGVDLPLCQAATAYSGEETAWINERVRQLTNGQVMSVRSRSLTEWVAGMIAPDARALMERAKDDGGTRESMDKSARAALVAYAQDYPDDIPAHVLEVIQCADDIWASSVAKFKRLNELANADSRVRGALVFAGGSATGRASSYGAQVHNFTRKCAKQPDEVRGALVAGQAVVPEFGARITDVLRGMLRPSLLAQKGKVLVSADWAAIEARVTPWAAGGTFAREKLAMFERGDDVYKVNAARTFMVDERGVTDYQRQIGKVQELALGFAGGAGAFASMGRNYGLTFGEADAERMVRAWRRANPWALRYWNTLEEGYKTAMRAPGAEIPAGRVTYYYDRTHLWYVLPSGRVLCYPYARIEDGNITYAKAAWKPAANANTWPRARLWRGLACENITQAIAADLLRNALREIEDAGLDVVLHVHDEVVVETADAPRAVDVLTRVMTQCPSWADGLPLAIGKPAIGVRYGKG